MKFVSPLIAFTSVFSPLVAIAQIIPDGTTSSEVTTTDTGIQIDDGDRRGDNLFHSFSEFSIPTGTEAFFNNANDVVNIFSRVTGGKISNIDGLIRANGTANLFLINPTGIVFGRGAALQLGGSFYGSTADSIVFGDGEFSATDLNNPPLITINAPVGLNFRDEPGKIINNSQAIDLESQSLVGLQVQPGETLALIGGELDLNGGILTAPGGNIELGSVSGSSLVNLVETARGFVPEYGGVENFGNIRLDGRAVVNTSGLGAGTIAVRGKQLSIQDGSQIVAITQGDLQGGTISIETSELVELQGISSEGQIPSSIQNHTQGTGDSGDLIINTGKLKISDGALIFAATFAGGTGGDISITTSEGIEITGSGFDRYQETFIRGILLGTTRSAEEVNGISVGTLGAGKSGNVVLETPSLQMSNGASIFSPTFANGIGGDIQINTSESLEIRGGALQSGSAFNSTGPAGDIIVNGKDLKIADGGIIVSATLGSAAGGNIIINASESLELVNTPPEALIPGGILANSSQGTGQAGDIQIDTKNLSITDGAVINNNSGAIIPNPTLPGGFLRLPGGLGGNIQINASNSVNIAGISSNGVTSSGIGTTALSGLTSPAGEIDISTKNLTLQDGARINAATISGGDGGKITIEATESITVSGQSQLGEVALVEGFVPSSISATSGRIDIPFETTGKAGDLSITTGQLIIRDTGEIGINSISLGEAGNLEIIANSIVLDNQGTISAATSFGQGGNISLQVDRTLTLRDESLISARAESNANGGNIEIDTEFIVAYPSGGNGNDILASARQGEGGNIEIQASSLLGIKENRAIANNGTNDIDASSDFGLNGNVSVNSPDVNSFLEIPQISDNFIFSDVITASNVCSVSDIERQSRFIVKNKGGVPPEPIKPLEIDVINVEGETLTTQSNQPLAIDNNSTAIEPVGYQKNGEPIYLARGIVLTEDGEVILTAYPTPQTPGYREYREEMLYGCR